MRTQEEATAELPGPACEFSSFRACHEESVGAGRLQWNERSLHRLAEDHPGHGELAPTGCGQPAHV